MKTDPWGIDERFWERLKYRSAPIKQHVLGDLPDSGAPLLSDRLWQTFQQRCATEGNLVPLLISQLEPQNPDPGMFRRHGPRKPKGSEPFGDLPLIQRLQAEEKFRQLCEKWAGNLPSWRRAILVGVACRLTLHPPGTDCGRRMRRIKGGLHCQRKYREQGWHPLSRFNHAMAKRQSQVCITETVRTAAQEARERLGLTAEQTRGVPRIAPLLASIEGGMEQIIEALRWSRHPDAMTFLAKYDSVPQTDLKHLAIEDICLAAGVEPRQIFSLAVDGLVQISTNMAKLLLFSYLPGIMENTVKSALTDKGIRDRRLVFLMTGLLPIPKDWSTPFALQNAAAQQIEKRPSGQSCDTETAPAALPWQSKTDERRG